MLHSSRQPSGCAVRPAEAGPQPRRARPQHKPLLTLSDRVRWQGLSPAAAAPQQQQQQQQHSTQTPQARARCTSRRSTPKQIVITPNQARAACRRHAKKRRRGAPPRHLLSTPLPFPSPAFQRTVPPLPQPGPLPCIHPTLRLYQSSSHRTPATPPYRARPSRPLIAAGRARAWPSCRCRPALLQFSLHDRCTC